MPIQIYWDKTDATVIHADIVGRYTWDEFDAQIEQLTQLVSHANYPVALIWDVSRSAPMPPQDAVKHLQKAVEGFPSNVELTIVVGIINKFGRVIWNKITTLYKRLNGSVTFVESVDDAYIAIANCRCKKVQASAK